MLNDPQKLSKILGDKTAKAFEKHLGIFTVGELLEHYPRRYAERGELTNFQSLPIGELVSVVGEVHNVSVRRMKGRQGSLLEVTLSDGISNLTLAFFNQAWRQNELKPGVRGLFSGRVGAFSGKLQLAHPDYELFEELDDQAAKAWAELPIPIYKSAGTLTTWKIQKAMAIALDSIQLKELLPAELLKSEKQLPLLKAIELVHRPKTKEDFLKARSSLVLHEALVLHLELSHQRQLLGESESEKRVPGELLESFDKDLPFELTSGQKLVSADIFSDLASGTPMHRLLQGEVGSGKTVVALRSVLAVAQSKGQSALLAPTEVLASQHFHSLVKSLGPELTKSLGVKLLTGQLPTAERKKVLLDLASGKCLLVIGTHALISEAVSFYDLGLVIIDEQHRFGVGQRERLRLKANKSPHVLAMTATPIPRTLAITVFGDLDVSTLTELPAGRKEISTHVVQVNNPALVARVWQRVAEEIAKGHQVFVVCPRIDGKVSEPSGAQDNELEISEGPAAASAVEVFESLKQNPVLSGSQIGLLHGRLAGELKAEVMGKFERAELDVLVSTTVIEVGVNVPNATVMVVLDADRFGISQLHQLRGRVGRGDAAGLCLLVSGAEADSVAAQRLDAVAATTDGFKLSEVDLELRGEGDVLGQVQSGGRSSLKMLRVVRDSELIVRTKSIAQELYMQGLGSELGALIQKEDARALKQS
jgi:ATP-dependent DNA helicase RecG